MLGAPTLGGCASHPPDSAKAKAIAAANASTDTVPTDLDGGVRQAQLLRLAGKYDDAIHVLSQLMLVASDDPRVVGEYGKTLAQQGRSDDAVQFLGRAVELKSDDWTVYSALGVAYDQLGNQAAAKVAYEQALALKPDEPSVLNNYALSRMLAKDPTAARGLIERAQIAGGASDPMIARNIAMIDKLVPAAAPPTGLAYAVTKPAPSAPATALASSAAPQPFVKVAPLDAPRVTAPVSAPVPAPATVASTTPGVIMQKIPVDPLAGPVHARTRVAKATPKPAAAEKSARAEPAAPAHAEPVASANAEPVTSMRPPLEAIAKSMPVGTASAAPRPLSPLVSEPAARPSVDTKPAPAAAEKTAPSQKTASLGKVAEKTDAAKPAAQPASKSAAKSAKPAAKSAASAMPQLRLAADSSAP